jgi:hypothetical protein
MSFHTLSTLGLICSLMISCDQAPDQPQNKQSSVDADIDRLPEYLFIPKEAAQLSYYPSQTATENRPGGGARVEYTLPEQVCKFPNKLIQRIHDFYDERGFRPIMRNPVTLLPSTDPDLWGEVPLRTGDAMVWMGFWAKAEGIVVNITLSIPLNQGSGKECSGITAYFKGQLGQDMLRRIDTFDPRPWNEPTTQTSDKERGTGAFIVNGGEGDRSQKE